MKKILIYRDEGADPFCVASLVSSLKQEKFHQTYLIDWADKHLFREASWQKDTQLLIFPGGRDIPYHQALEGSGNHHISDFVCNGGNFLGICAGGYYGSASIEFEQGGPLEVVANRELKFFPGIARGPIYGLGKFHYQSDQGAQIAKLSLSPSTSSFVSIYYNGGCAFVKAECYDNISIIARYADIDEQPPAIVKCAVGTGQAILCGVHPEYNTYSACFKNCLQDPHLFELKKMEQDRRSLFLSILKQLGC